jgi:hypothetical protein
MATEKGIDSKYQRFYSVVSDIYGIDPLKDSLVPEILKIKTFTNHAVSQEERGAPDLISYNEYGTEELWWFILTYNGIGSFRNIVEGMTLKIPDYSAIISIVSNNSTRPSVVPRVITI